MAYFGAPKCMGSRGGCSSLTIRCRFWHDWCGRETPICCEGRFKAVNGNVFTSSFLFHFIYLVSHCI